MATITISGGPGGVLKNVLTLIGIALILINFEGALISPRKALNKFYGIRHENSIQVHLMQLLCCVRLGLGFILLSTRL